MNVILDYGMGNLRSVQKALEQIGYDATISDDPDTVRDAELLVVPGVGAFDRAVKNIRESGLWDLTLRHLEQSKPYLGICLGFQLLFEGSEEGQREGFSYYSGTCRRFDGVSPVPHMGWNEVEWVNEGNSYDPGRTDNPCYYFVHSFFPEPEEAGIVAGRTRYGRDFCSAVAGDGVLGVQFHPEKSQYAGLDLLTKFMDKYS